MTNKDINRKHQQISLSQYEELKAKKGKRKSLPDVPKPVALIFALPVVFFFILIAGYVFYIRQLATP